MKSTVKSIADFYKAYPEYKSQIQVKTQYGYYPIDEAGITAYNEEVFTIQTKTGKTLNCSKNHKVLQYIDDKTEFTPIKYINNGSKIVTEDGVEVVQHIRQTKRVENLYDLQVREVQEYYTNGIVSHNSTLVDSVYFAIFGDTLRDIKKDLIPNNLTGGTTHVELDFIVDTPNQTKSYKIIRNLQPSKVQLFEDGVDITRDSIQNTSKQICDLLSATPAVFRNCVIMDINGTTPFMAKSKTDKRKFIEDIFGLEVFSQMLSHLRADKNAKKRDADIITGKYEEVEKTLNQYSTQKDAVLNRRKEKHQLYLQRQQDNVIKKQNIEQQLQSINIPNLADIEEQKKKFEQSSSICDEKIVECASAIASLSSENKHLKGIVSEIGTSKSKCPVCLKDITEHDRELIDSEKAKLNQQISDNLNQINELSVKDKKIKQIKEQVKLKIQECTKATNKAIELQGKKKELEAQLKQILDWQQELIVDIDRVQGGATDFDRLIDETQERLDILTKQNNELASEINKLDIVNFVISEEGVKSYIVNKLLELLNNLMVTYLKRLDANSICTFNEYFEEEIVNESNKICSYFNFSGAERKAMDLACLFTFADMRRMQGGVSYNLAIYDELFDSSFDERGIELILDILKERVEQYDECNLIISHRKESIKNVDGEVICLEKENGITRRVEYQS